MYFCGFYPRSVILSGNFYAVKIEPKNLILQSKGDIVFYWEFSTTFVVILSKRQRVEVSRDFLENLAISLIICFIQFYSLFCRVTPYYLVISNLFKGEKEPFRTVPIPLLPPLPPNDSGFPRDPSGKEEENLLDFLFVPNGTISKCATLPSCHSERKNFKEIFELKDLVFFLRTRAPSIVILSKRQRVEVSQ